MMPVLLPVLISGKQGSGKSSTAAAVHGMLEARGHHVFTYKFASVLYEMHNAVLGVANHYRIPVPEKDGRLLQLLGTDWGRQVYGEDVWVNCAGTRFLQTRKDVGAGVFGGTDKSLAVFLIDDLRFRNEMRAFVELGALTFRLEATRDARKSRTVSWRETDTHQSEVDLDESLSLFTHVYRTDGDQTCEDIAASIVAKISNY